MSRSTRTIAKIKAALAIYENDCMLGAPEEECKECTRVTFDSVQNIIEAAEKEAAAEEKTAEERQKATRKHIRGMLHPIAEIITQHMVEDIEAFIDGWRNQCLYYRPGEDPKEIDIDALRIMIRDAQERTLKFYENGQATEGAEEFEIRADGRVERITIYQEGEK